MKTFLPLFALLAALASASSAQAPTQDFDDWLDRQILAASTYVLISDGVSYMTDFHAYFLGRRNALLEVRTRLP